MKRSYSWDELGTRSWQEITKRWDAARYRLGFPPAGTDRSAEACGRPQFFFSKEDLPGLVSLLDERLPEQSAEILERAKRICSHQFDLLGYERLDYGSEIDWHADPVNGKRAPRKPWYRIQYLDFKEVGDAKVIWELSRHQHLATLAKAYLLSKDQQYAEELVRQWYHWWQENPYPMGINWASSLEVSFRALSWLWIAHWLSNSQAVPEQFSKDLLRALGISGRHIERYLSTYFSPNTHLLGEGVALFFIGILCPQLRGARRWGQIGWKIVLRESQRQVQADGMHFEQSTYYHVYALDFFLHARILAAANQIFVPSTFDRTIEKMLQVLRCLSQAGPPPRFGDDDGGRVFNPHRNQAQHLRDSLSIGAALFNRPEFKLNSSITEEFIWLLGANGIKAFDSLAAIPIIPSSAAFRNSGIYVMTGQEIVPNQVVMDSGRLGSGRGGHGHADALSLCMAINGREWLVDPGTFTYVGAGNSRNSFRGTGSHSTLMVDGADQAEPVETFAWRTQPDVQVENWIAGETFDLLIANHNGYSRLSDPVTHRRAIFRVKSFFTLVLDAALGQGVHRLDLSWHLAPGSTPRLLETGCTCLTGEDSSALAIVPAAGHGWTQEVKSEWYSTAYGSKVPSPVLHFEKRAALPARFVTLLQPIFAPATELGTLEPVREARTESGLQCYVYSTPEEWHYFFTADNSNPWEISSWASDASFLYCGVSPEGTLRRMVVCGGSFVVMNRRRVFSARGKVERFEWPAGRTEKQFSSSDEKAIELIPESEVINKETVLSGDRVQDDKRGAT